MNEQQALEQLNKIAEGAPYFLNVDQYGKVVKITYEKKWKTGGTKAVEDEKGNIVDYEADYTDHELSDQQVAALDKFIKENIR